MPTLHWASKSLPLLNPASLELDSVVHPLGSGYPTLSEDSRLDTPSSSLQPFHPRLDNQLILGDNLAVMSALLPEYEGKLDLIYADPPFFTNKRYPARIGRGEDSRKPQQWKLAEGYPDAWTNLDDYLDMLYPRLVIMHRLLAPTGSLYLHLDWHANAYARLLLDEIFGFERLLNEIIWVYHGPSPIRSAFNRKHDTILAYTKGEQYTFNVDAVRQPYDPITVKTFASSPKAGFGKVPDLERGKVPEDWWYFPVIARLHHQRSGYPTQKPEALLERIILASSNPGDLVADFFCGSGTTPLVSARLGRRFIASDITWRAVHTTHQRLVNLPCEPFEVKVEASRFHQDSPSGNSALNLKPANFILSEGTIELKTDNLDEINYWEVDPAWDGKTFHSAAQAVRPPRKKTLASRLELPVTPGKRPVCIRVIDIQGNLTQLIVER